MHRARPVTSNDTGMKRKIDIKEFADAVRYVKAAECVDHARIPSLVKMLGCKPMELMEFITGNPGLMHLEERFSPGGNKSLGLCVIDVYGSEEENPWTAAGLDKMIADNGNRIWVSEIRDQWRKSGLLGYSVNEDFVEPEFVKNEPADARRLKWLWRNTAGKISVLKGMGFCKPRVLAFSDYGTGCYNKEIGNYLSEEDVESIRGNGVFEVIILK